MELVILLLRPSNLTFNSWDIPNTYILAFTTTFSLVKRVRGVSSIIQLLKKKTTLESGWLLHDRNLFLTVLDAGKSRI